ncbi:ATP-binding protein [Flavobacterium eburneipallidum]|uniref:ATP-binding protein n=1 Tax=Flavobacterium eburneipallidum TaxID=3003263 RepID=UPI0024830156|nr:ATP-binding protein [Flavobacterium eburneipallidum]
MKFIFEKKAFLFYILSAILLSTVLAIFYLNNQKDKAVTKKLIHTQEVISKSNEVLLDVLTIETGFRGYLLSGDAQFLEPYNKFKSKTNTNIDHLVLLTKDSKRQQDRIEVLNQSLTQRLVLIEKYVTNEKPVLLNNLQKKAIIQEGKVLTDKIRNSINAINNEQFGLLKVRKIENENSNQFSGLLFLLLLIFLVAIFIFVVLIINNQKVKQSVLEIDTADQKIASQYSLSLIEASLDPLVTISVTGKIMDMNQALVRITGMEREALTGSYFFDYFTEPQIAREVYEEVFDKGSVADSPLTLRHKDGKLTDVLCNGSVYKDEQQNVMGVVIVARDVTDQKRIATELIEARIFAELATEIAEGEKRNAQAATLIAENAVKAKQQFLSNMSHEIRTPMNAIIGFTKVVLKTELTEKQKEYLSAIKMSGDALIVLINDILDLAKVDAGKMTFEKVPFKLSASISAMLHIFETKIQEKNLKLVTEYDAKIPKVLLGDPVRLHQIILNLVSNAIKFTSKGKITVSVQLLKEDEESVTVEFAIADTGIGIHESKIDTIFDDFQQATSGTSRLYGGTGLGLAIVKQLVEPQGGTVSVKSTIKEGSTFSFVLRFLKTNEAAENETELVALETEIKNIKILVVEDMPLNQLLMKTLLDDFGFERAIAENGQIAIEKLQSETYDVVLMDLQMPIMNGFDATEYIRNTLKLDIPIIALTADVTTVDLAKCKAVGMNDYIAKPVDERLLYSKIISAIKNKRNSKTVKKLPKSPKTKVTNLDYLKIRTKSNSKLMVEMITIFLQQTRPLIVAMKQSLSNKDWELLGASVHKLIPSFSIMGMSPDLEQIAKKIQYAINANQFTDETAKMVVELETVCQQACEELEIELNLIKNTVS